MLDLSSYGDWALLIARIIMGIVMLFYGWPKIKSLKSNAKDFEGMGFYPGIFWGTIVALVEFLGGVAIIFGIYAQIAALLFSFEMIMGTIWKVKKGKPFTDYSYDLMLLALGLLIAVFGTGIYALAGF